MMPSGQTAGHRRSQNNEDRARSAARRQATAARWALAVLAAHHVGPELSGTPVWRRQWIDVLRRRAADELSTLSGLAATMSPPMTKDAFAGQLRRACRFAAVVASGTAADGVLPDAPAPGDLRPSDFGGRPVEKWSCAEDLTTNPSAPVCDQVR